MIVITGMHRSGTSFTSRLLHGLDVDFGDHSALASADRWNPKGYFENIDLQILHDKIVMGSAFPTERFRTTPEQDRDFWLKLVMSIGRVSYMFFDVQAVKRRATIYQDEMRHIGDRFAHVAVKDPRFSFTITEWAKRANIEKVLYCYRHPYEVALSLQQRYRFPLAIGVALWSHHIEEFFKQAAGFPIVVVNYNNFFHDDTRLAEVSRLFNFLEKPFDEHLARRLINATLDDRLRRHTVPDGKALPPREARLYAMLYEVHRRHAALSPLT
jgi:hypothetical protein